MKRLNQTGKDKKDQQIKCEIYHKKVDETIEDGEEMEKKWRKNGEKMERKWKGNGEEVERKCSLG